ncbi:MAG: ADP-ribosylation factor-like protein [Kiritimatiellia bacterium]|nr:ADP-ribosylation factor-like protein [Kiritimatiellia bacterium]MDP6631588.1 ADP-ribosylation factor-like protein [Kiritimatiellia bacterium]MDP6810187.1 ADP-ribosylation factor-like protein [Kiritimatiellia bacterium]MDP7022907.1 ADP-ribosylation factor-like protein [Kiritimatiellia bacterium]
MSCINFARKELQLKIVYYGPGMCGKTTNLQTIHRMIDPGTCSDMASIATDGDRTLFFDFMPLEADAVAGYTTKFQMYTVPGQPVYDMTRRLVLKGVDGIVFVADSQWSRVEDNVESLANLEENLALQGDDLASMPLVMQYNKRDLDDIAPVHYLAYTLERESLEWPWFESVATEGAGTFDTLNTISRLVLQKFVARYNEQAADQRDLVMV